MGVDEGNLHLIDRSDVDVTDTGKLSNNKRCT